ncbi:MAG TPA: hypothetical protein VJR23_10795 [Candidatus Acidoferrales bacterium]|nr:hypothetical protein [Candidatus Acidoferrales bacterium]
MRLRAHHFLSIVAAAILVAVPVWAHTDSVRVQLTHTVTISGTQLKPGSYDLKVQDSGNDVNIFQDGNKIAQVPCKWVQLSKKSDYSDVQFTKNRITELDFHGKTEAVRFD